MSEVSKDVLKKLIRKRPKPNKKELQELFTVIKSTSLEELMSLYEAKTEPKQQARKSDLESYVRSRLKKNGGKITQFVPYILNHLHSVGKLSAETHFNAKSKLTSVIDLVQNELGDKAKDGIDAAFKSYINDYDTSYKLKSA